ncbi:transmembrane protein C16orf54 homolog [Elgaria multicarinata webbii]|uniref:transmembrane protein C16orf54 homolog n=1 Tax=Elgaria multicarinata webbii TaxID=159646 RepID=UPI002FCCF1FB
MPPPSTASPLSECNECLLIMIALAVVAGVFMVISAILCDRLFHGSMPSKTRSMPSVWRQGGTLWIEPTQNHKEPDVLSRPSETVPLWIQRSNDWFMDAAAAELGSCDSSRDLQRETSSPSSTSPLWGHDEPPWGVQPRVTLQDLQGFFRHGSRHS